MWIEYAKHLHSSWVKVANNPANSSFTVMFDESMLPQRKPSEARINSNKQLYDIKLYGWKMDLLKQATSHGEDVTINTTNLPAHIYFLHVDNGRETKKIKVLVEH